MCHTGHTYHSPGSLVYKCVIVGFLETDFNKVRERVGGQKVVLRPLATTSYNQPKAKKRTLLSTVLKVESKLLS
jgi:hypothetical protein